MRRGLDEKPVAVLGRLRGPFGKVSACEVPEIGIWAGVLGDSDCVSCDRQGHRRRTPRHDSNSHHRRLGLNGVEIARAQHASRQLQDSSFLHISSKVLRQRQS